ncbi:hotdog family protein [Nocardioides pacificus]
MTEHAPDETAPHKSGPHKSGLVVPARFCGPPGSGNGGWTAGALAALVPSAACPTNRADAWPAVEVTLRRPPPLDVAMSVTTQRGADESDGPTLASCDGQVVAEARLAGRDLVPVEPVTPEAARAASAGYPGFTRHPFPTCFSCGPDREEGDGLRIFPGPVAGTDRWAATWRPRAGTVEDYHHYVDEHPRASLAVTWAALDCVSGWAGGVADRVMVLGRMTAEIDALPIIGDEHVVVGHTLGTEGRRTTTASTLYDSDGRVVARAEHTWVEVDPSAFNAS